MNVTKIIQGIHYAPTREVLTQHLDTVEAAINRNEVTLTTRDWERIEQAVQAKADALRPEPRTSVRATA